MQAVLVFYGEYREWPHMMRESVCDFFKLLSDYFCEIRINAAGGWGAILQPRWVSEVR